MKIRQYNGFKLQRGVASLLVATMLLISITLVVLFTSKTVLMETKITADDYRTSQATAAAQAAMDRAVSYVADSNMDHDDDGDPDFITPVLNPAPAVGDPEQMPSATNCTIPVTVDAIDLDAYLALPSHDKYPAFVERLTSGEQSTFGLFYFVNTSTYDHDNDTTTAEIDNPCNDVDDSLAAEPVNIGLLVAKGWSDDCTAVRTITQCLGLVKIFDNKGPQQPFVTHGSIGIAGNATFINRYSTSNVWTGGSLEGAGAAFATYLRPDDVKLSDLTTDELNAGCDNPCKYTDPANNVSLISNLKTGFGADVIGDDPTLGNLDADGIFTLFFGEKTRDDMKTLAKENGQYYTDINDAEGKEGFMWMEGDANAIDLGAPGKPVILIVNGNFTIGANAKIYGVIYLTGVDSVLTVNGGPEIYGSVISESGKTSGTGNPTIVYVPMGGSKNPPPPDIPTIIPGSWRDW